MKLTGPVFLPGDLVVPAQDINGAQLRKEGFILGEITKADPGAIGVCFQTLCGTRGWLPHRNRNSYLLRYYFKKLQ